jgi:hypothetical protein
LWPIAFKGILLRLVHGRIGNSRSALGIGIRR